MNKVLIITKNKEVVSSCARYCSEHLIHRNSFKLHNISHRGNGGL